MIQRPSWLASRTTRTHSVLGGVPRIRPLQLDVDFDHFAAVAPIGTMAPWTCAVPTTTAGSGSGAREFNTLVGLHVMYRALGYVACSAANLR